MLGGTLIKSRRAWGNLDLNIYSDHCETGSNQNQGIVSWSIPSLQSFTVMPKTGIYLIGHIFASDSLFRGCFWTMCRQMMEGNILVQRSKQGESCSTPSLTVHEDTTGSAKEEFNVIADNTLMNRGTNGNEPPAPISTCSGPIRHESARGPDGAVLLLLVGVPGSGKSTFCNNLMSNAAHPWTRICQDIIANGKSGTKKECLKHSQSALKQSHNVVIDRCNVDKPQRLEFLELAASLRVEAHAVVLNLPRSVCIQRASKRIGHEGGVNGGNAGSIISRFSRSFQLPSLSEGFSRITLCRTDAEVERALHQYRNVRPSKPLESGIFGAIANQKKNMHIRGKGTAQKTGADRGSNYQQDVKSNKRIQPSLACTEAFELDENGWSSRIIGSTNASEWSANASADDQGPPILAFPSISTSDFQFDHERASDVLVDVLSEFLHMTGNPKLRLMLVDLTRSHMLSIVQKKASEKGLDSLGFSTFVGDITKLRRSGGPPCNVIANAANWRLKGGGGGVNAAIHKAAGPELEQATKKVAQTISPGTSVVVRLPVSSPFHKQEGVTHVIHVLGPNMNPNRPNCLSGDYSEGCRILRSAYSSLFENFISVAGHNLLSESMHKTIKFDDRNTCQKSTKNAFSVLMQASKRNREAIDSNSKREKVTLTKDIVAQGDRDLEQKQVLHTRDQAQPAVLRMQLCPGSDQLSMSEDQGVLSPQEELDVNNHRVMAPTSGHQGGSEKQRDATCGTSCDVEAINNSRQWGNWALALYKVAMNPQQHKDIILQATDDAVVIRDAYPKAKRHVLVVARRRGLDSLQDARLEHLPLLQHVHSLGQEWAAYYLRDDPSLNFRLGYHLVPSLRQVHLHVVSQDFESSSLKNKKHWNSFTTPFFRDSSDVLEQLEVQGCLQINVKDAEYLLDLELRCHRCRSVHPNLPRLKQHIATCKLPFTRVPHLICAESVATRIPAVLQSADAVACRVSP